MKRAGGSIGGCEAESIAHVLMLLSQDGVESNNLVQYYPAQEQRVFECKTCNRRFPSFQALGGHRASHKKPKPSSIEGADESGGAFVKPKLHECSICGLEFSIGQALGGHMRRHRQISTGGCILDITKSCTERGDDGLFDVDMCERDRELVTLNLFL